MPATILKGDIFGASDLRAYAHGCNCAGTMDAGIAVAFKKKWPRMFEDYAKRCADGRFNLGDVLVWTEGDETVYNLAIQEHWKKKATMAALSRAVRKMLELAEAAGVKRIGLPRIGAGLGGADEATLDDPPQTRTTSGRAVGECNGGARANCVRP